MAARAKVLLTDHPWAGIDIEHSALSAAGMDLIEAPAMATPTQLASLAEEAAGILTCWSPVTRDIVEAAPSLRVISRLGVGLDNIDLDAAAEAGVTVTNVPEYCTDEVAEHVLAFVVTWARRLPWALQDTKTGTWEPCARLPRPLSELKIGVLGNGRIGARVADKLAAAGCQVQVLGRSSPDELRTLFRDSDVISLHVPYSAATHHLVNAELLAVMKAGSLLINTSRGGLVDTAALMDALADGRPECAALDVVEGEPKPSEAVRSHPQVLLTPHMAFASTRSLAELRTTACDDLIRVLQGVTPRHPVGLR